MSPADDQTGGITFTAAEAARRCGVPRSTLTRKLRESEIPGAIKGADGWQIPLSGLLAAGLSPGRYEPRDPQAPEPEEQSTAAESTAVQLARMEGQLAAERAHRAAAEALAKERLDRITDLQAHLRALEPPPPAEPEQSPTEPDQDADQSPTEPPARTAPTPEPRNPGNRLTRWFRAITD